MRTLVVLWYIGLALHLSPRGKFALFLALLPWSQNWTMLLFELEVLAIYIYYSMTKTTITLSQLTRDAGATASSDARRTVCSNSNGARACTLFKIPLRASELQNAIDRRHPQNLVPSCRTGTYWTDPMASDVGDLPPAGTRTYR